MNEGFRRDLALLRIHRIHFKAGSSHSTEPLVIHPGSVTIFVGPNNSGKSLALREMCSWLKGEPVDWKALEHINLTYPENPETISRLLDRFRTEPSASHEYERVERGEIVLTQPSLLPDIKPRRNLIHPDTVQSWFNSREDNASSERSLRTAVVSWYALMLDSRTRFALTDPQRTGPLDDHPRNHLWYLFVNRDAREKVRQTCEAAFPGLHFTIDATGMIEFRIRMSTVKPCPEIEESIGPEGRAFHRDSQLIQALGDGVKTYVGLIAAAVSLDHKFLFIDDPEAHLHPPVARRLGANLTILAEDRDSQILLSTHSGEVLAGCLESSRNCSVVRLTYNEMDGSATATELERRSLLQLMHEPLLRSVRVLNALFHSAAVVAEADTDRVFYEEINRLLQANGEGLADGIFLRAQNRGTVQKVVDVLTKMGVPTAAVVDVDFIYDAGNHLEHLLRACLVPDNEISCLLGDTKVLQVDLAKHVTRDDYKMAGIRAGTLPNEVKLNAESLLERYANHGIFIVPIGELESWLEYLNIPGSGRKWLVNCLRILEERNVKPQAGDVWDFMRHISSWIEGRLQRGAMAEKQRSVVSS